MDYNSTKEHLFEYLKELTEQIKYMIFCKRQILRLG